MSNFIGITDTATFAKLYPVRFPVPAHASYYLSRLVGAVAKPILPLAYPWLPQALRDFADLEAETGAAALDALGGVLHRCRAKLAIELGGRTIHHHLDPAAGFVQKDVISSGVGKVLGRIDLVSANYSAVRKYNPGLPATWESLCADLEIPLAISRSKSFRQSVLGLGNPKWQQRVQARAIQAVIELVTKFLPTFRDRIIRCSPDEIVFPVQSEAERWLFDQIAKSCSMPDPEPALMPARFEVFTLRRLSFAKAFTWTNLDPVTLFPVSVQPFMVPGNRFYIWLTRVVYGQTVVCHGDVEYIDDGEIARWAYDYNRGSAHLDEQ